VAISKSIRAIEAEPIQREILRLRAATETCQHTNQLWKVILMFMFSFLHSLHFTDHIFVTI